MRARTQRAMAGRHSRSVRRARGDQVIVLLVLIAIWQACSLTFGTYWVGSPWGVLTRFITGIFGGDLLRHASYTLIEAVAGFLIGALPAAALPFWLRRSSDASRAILDPFMVGGYGAPKLALAPLFILWFGIGIESKIALVAITVFFIVYFSAQAGVRALDTKLVQMAQGRRRDRAAARAPHRVSRRGAVHLHRPAHRHAVFDRRRGDRRADLVQSRARLSGAARRDEFRHHRHLRRAGGDHLHRLSRQLERQRGRAAAVALASARRHRGMQAGHEQALLEVRDLAKRFAGAQRARRAAVGDPGPELLGGRGRVPHHHRAVGRRQDHAAQHDCADRRRERRRSALPVGARADRRSEGAQSRARPAASATSRRTTICCPGAPRCRTCCSRSTCRGGSMPRRARAPTC